MKKGSVMRATAMLLVVILLGVGLGWLTEGFKNWNPRTWFGKGNSVNMGGGVVDGDGNELESGKVYPMPKQMVFSKASAESSASEGITIKASVTPENATDKRLKADIEFVKPPVGSTGDRPYNYIELTTIENGVYNLKCLKPSTVAINLVISSVFNPSIKAICQIDFQKTYTAKFVFSIEGMPVVSLDSANNNNVFNYAPSTNLSSNYVRVSKNPIVTNGTIDYPVDEPLKYFVNSVINDDFYNGLISHASEFNLTIKKDKPTINLYNNESYSISKIYNMFVTGYENKDFTLGNNATLWDSTEIRALSAFAHLVENVYKLNSNVNMIDITVNNNGEVWNYYIKPDLTSYKIVDVGGVEVDNSTIIF